MIGIDFGTTNSTVARATRAGAVRFSEYQSGDSTAPLFRSALFFPDPEQVDPGTPEAFTDREAVERYEAFPEGGRLVKSLKTFLTAEKATTRIFQKQWTLEALLALLVRNLVRFSEQSLGKLEGPIVIGRPVQFVHQRTSVDEERALARIREAFSKAGINEVHFEYEPIAAAYTYERTLDHDEVVLVGDFGGGTSDFSIVRVGPKAQLDSGLERVLATAGIGIAGDVLDGRIVYHAAAPSLGLGELCTDFLTQRTSEVPRWFYTHLSDPVQHFALRERKTLALVGKCLSEIPDETARAKLKGFNTIVSEGLSYQLFHTAGHVKANLSKIPQQLFSFNWNSVHIESLVERPEFEQWIQPSVSRIQEVADQMLRSAGLTARDIDKVFLTGGTAQVPLLRKAFAGKFGAQKIAESTGFFTSVAEGLARRAEQIAREIL